MQLYLFLINVDISSLFRELYSRNSIYLSLQFGPYSVIKDIEGLNCEIQGAQHNYHDCTLAKFKLGAGSHWVGTPLAQP